MKTALVFTPDRAFFAPAIRAAASILEQSGAEAFDIFVICEERDVEPGFDALDPAIKRHIGLILTDFTPFDKGLLPRGRFSRAVFRRLFLSSLLPDSYEHYLTIDADMLIVRPGLEGLSGLDLGPHPFAAALDMIYFLDSFLQHRCRLGLSPHTPYFNAGLMLVDRHTWVRGELTQAVIARLQENPKHYPYMEQDALNQIVQGQFAPLNPRYNFMGDFFLTRLEDEIAPIVLHFVNQPKPWHYATWRGEGRFAQNYANWFAQAPFLAWRLQNNVEIAKKMPKKTRKRAEFAQKLRIFLQKYPFLDV